MKRLTLSLTFLLFIAACKKDKPLNIQPSTAKKYYIKFEDTSSKLSYYRESDKFDKENTGHYHAVNTFWTDGAGTINSKGFTITVWEKSENPGMYLSIALKNSQSTEQTTIKFGDDQAFSLSIFSGQNVADGNIALYYIDEKRSVNVTLTQVDDDIVEGSFSGKDFKGSFRVHREP